MSDNYRILVIDDVEDIHTDFNKILIPKKPTKHPRLDEMNAMLLGATAPKDTLPRFEITSAYQGEEGVNLVKKSLRDKLPFAVIFVDVQMPPGEDGVETISRIWELDQEVQTVICTAYAKYSWQDIMQRFGDTDRLFVLKKPFDNLELIQFACSLSKRWNLNNALNIQIGKTKKEASAPTTSPTENNSVNMIRKSVEELRLLNEKLKNKK